MTPVRSVKNQYLGINAHLHSYFQSAGGWNGFHTTHIGDLNKLLKARLLPMGYTTELEASLQIRRADEPIGEPESDISVYDLDPVRPLQEIVPRSGHAGELVLPIPEALMPLKKSAKEHSAIAIYQLVGGKRDRGTLVAWIELLSPSNKIRNLDGEAYQEKRLKLIQSGIVYVEIDYLHETHPTVRVPASYRTRKGQPAQPGSHPYRIVVMDSRPAWEAGQARIIEFDVDQAIPPVRIPLSAGDSLDFDFGVPYNKTFEETLYGAELVDYSQLPLNFDRYNRDDQARILARMLAVLKAARDGVDLEQAPPLPTEPLELEAALSQLRTWQ